MSKSLCETCSNMKLVITPKQSRFLLCELWVKSSNYSKYPAQPKLRCDGYQVVKIPEKADSQLEGDNFA
jgi:hypothetical protein